MTKTGRDWLESMVALVEGITRIRRAREHTSLKNDLWASERLLRYCTGGNLAMTPDVAYLLKTTC